VAVKMSAGVIFLIVAITVVRGASGEYGYSMGAFSTGIRGDHLSGRQSWLPAAFLRDTLLWGVSCGVVDYFDDVDNFDDRTIVSGVVGGFIAHNSFCVKLSLSRFDAWRIYFRTTGFCSLGWTFFSVLNASVDLTGEQAGVSTVDSRRQTATIGATTVLTHRRVSVHARIHGIPLVEPAVPGYRDPVKVTAGIHTRSNPHGALGSAVTIVPVDPRPVRVALGMSFRPVAPIALNGALRSYPFSLGFGVEVTLLGQSGGVSFANHPDLGWTKCIFFDWTHR